MRSITFLVFAVFFPLLFSCGGDNEVEETLEYEFKLTESYREFPLPDDAGHFGLGFRRVGDELFFLDFKGSRILVYSIATGELTKTVNLEKEGPNGVGDHILYYQVENSDEFYLAPATGGILKIDGNGQILERFEVDSKPLEAVGASLFSSVFMKKDDYLYFSVFPSSFAWTEVSPEDLLQMPNLAKYSLVDQTLIPVSFYPTEFVGDNLNKSIFPLLAIGPGGDPIINHNFRNIYRVTADSVFSHLASHSRFPIDPPLSSSPNMFDDFQEVMRIISYTDIYSDFFYFEDLEIAVRVAKFEDLPASEDMNEYLVASKWSIVFLDGNLEKIGEIDLPENKSYPKYIFSTSEGIWVSSDHPENPDLKEDNMRFRLIEIQK